MRPLFALLCVLLATPAFASTKAAKLPAHVTVDYDRFRDSTMVMLQPQSLRTTGLDIGASFWCGKDSVRCPSAMLLFFRYYGSDWRYLRPSEHRLELVMGDRRLTLVMGHNGGEIEKGGFVSETMGAILPSVLVARILRGPTSGRMGSAEFRIVEKDSRFAPFLAFVRCRVDSDSTR
jgi:hypothetical protein